jgi:hypothetical protein
MRRIILASVAGLVLVVAGVAVAHGFESKAVKQVSATFAATAASNLRTSTCTGTDGTYAKSVATYTGSATSSEPALNGAARIEAASFVNTTTGVGTVWGNARIDTAAGSTRFSFEGVLTHGSVVGLASGHSRRPDVKLLANISADYSAAGGFANGKIGGATAAGDAVLITQGGCHPPKPPKPPKPERVKAHGAITAVSTTSITVAGVTCAVPASKQNDVAKVKVGDVVSIECDVVNGANTLTHVSRHGHHK